MVARSIWRWPLVSSTVNKMHVRLNEEQVACGYYDDSRSMANHEITGLLLFLLFGKITVGSDILNYLPPMHQTNRR